MKRLLLWLSLLTSAHAATLQSYPTASVPASDDWLYLQGNTNSVRKLSPLYYLPATGPVALSLLAQTGATTNQVISWNGTNWAPGTVTTGVAWGAITGTLSAQTDLQNALNLKQAALTFTSPLVNTSNTVTLANTAVTPGSYTNTNLTVDAQGRITAAANGSSSATTWGTITGTLSSQTDLQNALNLKAPLASPTFTGTPAGPTATVGTNTTQLATTAFVLANQSTSVAWGSITGTLSSQSDLNSALGLKAPLASPALTGTPTAPTASAGTNTTQVATTAFVLANLPLPNFGVPIARSSNYTVSASDNGANEINTGSLTCTVNTGLPSGFGCSIKGTVSFAGSATVNDVRTSGASNPWCSVVQTGTNTYDAVGSKP